MPKRRRGTGPQAEASDEEASSDTSSSASESYDSMSSGSSDEGVQSEDGSDGEAFDSVTVDFDFAEPQESDFLGLKTLLTNYLDGQQYDASGLVDLVLKHSALGTLIRCEEEVIGVTTVVPLTEHWKDPCIAELLSFLQSRMDASGAAKLRDCVGVQATGLLLNERLMNCPPDVAPHLQQTLIEDLKDARKQVPLNRLLLVARAFREQVPTAKPTDKKGKKQVSSKTELVFLQPEVECLHAQAEWVAEFAVRQSDDTKSSTGRGAVPVRLVLCLGSRVLPGALKSLERLLAAAPE